MLKIDKQQLIDLILKSDKINLVISLGPPGSDNNEQPIVAELNDISYCTKTKELELWYNDGWEI